MADVVDVYFVSSYGKRLSPLQAAKEMGFSSLNPCIEAKLRVRETLLSRKGQLPEFVYFRDFAQGANYFQIEARPRGLAQWIGERKRDIGEKYIWFGDKVERREKAFFIRATKEITART